MISDSASLHFVLELWDTHFVTYTDTRRLLAANVGSADITTLFSCVTNCISIDVSIKDFHPTPVIFHDSELFYFQN